jgi:uncharacterized protein (TIRG00374 family)
MPTRYAHTNLIAHASGEVGSLIHRRSMLVKNRWKQLPESIRSILTWSAKLVVTVAVFYLLLTHRLTTADGGRISIWRAATGLMNTLTLGAMLPFLLIAIAIKFAGIFCSMLRWHLLLCALGIRFNFWHIVGSFLIGRFLGTFLPSTIGLDGYKLYDAARFSQRVVEPAAATVVEKILGLAGILLTFLLTLPFGYEVLGPHAASIAAITVPLALVATAGLVILVQRPGLLESMARWATSHNARLSTLFTRLARSARAFRGQTGLVLRALALSLAVHFTTSAMYYFTALAVGAQSASFFKVTFASSIQIFATVMSPLTVAGEGVREVMQALLLTRHLGASQSVLSAALGFWAAEALTLFGAVFWWSRRTGYKPRLLTLSVSRVDTYVRKPTQ